MNERLFPIILVAVLFVSGGALVYSAHQNREQDTVTSFVSSALAPIKEFVAAVAETAQTTSSNFDKGTTSSEPANTETQQKAPTPTTSPGLSPSPSPATQPKASPTPKASPAATKKPTPLITPKPQTTTQASCRRFVVKHLDGSQSNRCYTSSDYSELSRLASQLSSAQTFYQFHKEGADRYQKLYESSGSSLWLDAKASSQAQADQEQAKIGPLQLQMYTIESRGTD